MRFPRSAKILRSQFDMAPFAAVLFAMLILLLLANWLPVPGLRASLVPPPAGDLAGVTTPAIAVGMDVQGRLFLENQIVTERVLVNKLTVAGHLAPTPLTLVIHADRSCTYEQLTHLTLLAREAGITNALLATLPVVKP